MTRTSVGLTLLFCALSCAQASETFSFEPPGKLLAGTGDGYVEKEFRGPHSTAFRFPLETAPAFANSQVYARGGSHPPQDSKGGQCAPQNYAYPWRDNFCETRSNPQQVAPLCPQRSRIHMGQDIRPSTCENKKHWVVAPEDGIVSRVGSYSVRLRGDSGFEHLFLHMATETVAVKPGQRVARNDRLGKVSNNFGAACNNCTTYHLHYEIRSATGVVLPPYGTLLHSYQKLLAGTP